MSSFANLMSNVAADVRRHHNPAVSINCAEMKPHNERKLKRQRTAALQDAVAMDRTPLVPRGFGVRLSSAAFISAIGLKPRLRLPQL